MVRNWRVQELRKRSPITISLANKFKILTSSQQTRSSVIV